MADTLVDRVEEHVREAGGALAQKMEVMREVIGERGVFAEPVPEDENIAFYLGMKDDPVQWRAMMMQRAEANGGDIRMGIKDAVMFGIEMDKVLEKQANGSR